MAAAAPLDKLNKKKRENKNRSSNNAWSTLSLCWAGSSDSLTITKDANCHLKAESLRGWKVTVLLQFLSLYAHCQCLFYNSNSSVSKTLHCCIKCFEENMIRKSIKCNSRNYLSTKTCKIFHFSILPLVWDLSHHQGKGYVSVHA